jgi:hypothetical protein
MKINEIIVEASRGQKLAAKRQQSDAKRSAAQAAKDAEDARVAAKMQQRKQRNMASFNTPVSAKPRETPSTSGAFGGAEFEKYRVDDTVDSNFQGGYYLNFSADTDGVTAYWSSGNLSLSQAAQFKQIQPLGNKFNATVFQKLIDLLTLKSSRGGQPGYVNISFSRRYINNPFFRGLYEYLLKHYPQDDPTMDASVAWELEP